MINRTRVSCRPRSVSALALGVLACVAAVLALSPARTSAAEACPNEQLRSESAIDPATGKPFSAGLSECRAYEMVSPLYKQGFDAGTAGQTGSLVWPLVAAPDGNTAGFMSEGAFSGPENYSVSDDTAFNPYLSHRGASGWSTVSALAPRPLVDLPFQTGLNSDFSPDQGPSAVRVSCGMSPVGGSKGEERAGQGIVCAMHKPDGSWVGTPIYQNISNSQEGAQRDGYLGGSADLSRVFVQPQFRLLPNDAEAMQNHAGIYEIAGVGTESPELRRVSVDNSGKSLVLVTGEETHVAIGAKNIFGHAGSYYHAISSSGRTVFFSATPGGSGNDSETLIVYARVPCVLPQLGCETKSEDPEGRTVEGRQTVKVSNPTEKEGCKLCDGTNPKPASFQGASADGSKVFFTTSETLLNKDVTANVYEYDFNRKEGDKLVLVSRDEEAGGAKVQGVVRSSPDGTHIYFEASGVLTKEENQYGEKAETGQNNLYGYDTETEVTKFVAKGDLSTLRESTDLKRHAQTTPDGRFLVFSSRAKLAGDAAGEKVEQVYRYDFKTGKERGELTWVSHGAPGFTPDFSLTGKEHGAFIAARPSPELLTDASTAYIDDWSRAISGEGDGKYDGEAIVFTTGEKLQENDVNGVADVYVWHNGTDNGTVHLVSDGHDPQGVANKQEGEKSNNPGTSETPVAAMAASGSDIFFTTRAGLVGQDTDVLRDVYDARVGGGFPAPLAEPSCSGEACQGAASQAPSFGLAASFLTAAGGNLLPPRGATLAVKIAKLTRAQLLAKALKACRGKPKRKRAACESQARKRYGGKTKAKAKAKSKHTGRRGK